MADNITRPLLCIINNSNYLFVIDVDSVVVLAAFCILNPKINDDLPIKKETIPRIFPDRLGMILLRSLMLLVVVSGSAVALSHYFCPCP